jgi:MFS family permease
MAMALASTAAPRDRVPAAIGMVQSAQLLSVAVGPAVGGYVASHGGIRLAFFVTAGMCVVALIGLIIFFEEVTPGEPGAAKEPAARLPLRDLLGNRTSGRWPCSWSRSSSTAAFSDPAPGGAPAGHRAIAAVGIIISVAAVAATVSATSRRAVRDVGRRLS